MPGRRRSDEWYTPYFAPSTIVVGVLVIVISISAGRYVGNIMIERDKSRYTPSVEYIQPASGSTPTKVTRAAAPQHGKLSPSAKVSQ
jgi:hypothetical protein